MNQSIIIKQPLESPTSGQSRNNIVSLSKIRMHQRAVRRHRNNMIKQRLCGLSIILICFIVRLMTGDLTALCILGWIAFPMLFSKKYMMNFNKKV
mgnify:FL=1